MWLFESVARSAREGSDANNQNASRDYCDSGFSNRRQSGCLLLGRDAARAIHERYTVRESVVVIMNRRRSICAAETCRGGSVIAISLLNINDDAMSYRDRDPVKAPLSMAAAKAAAHHLFRGGKIHL